MLNNVVVSVENGQIVIFFQVQLTIARNQQLRHRSTCDKKSVNLQEVKRI